MTLAAAAVAAVIGRICIRCFSGSRAAGVSTALGVLVARLLSGRRYGRDLDHYRILFPHLLAGGIGLRAVRAVLLFLLFGMHPVTLAVIAISLLLVWRHKTNIRNLLAGRKAASAAARPARRGTKD